MPENVPLDVQQIVDAQPFGPAHLRIILLCGISVFMDGFDAQATGFVAPALAQQWGIARGALGPILTAGLAGMLMGALVFGPLADRFGRKRILILCTLWFGVFSLLTAAADSMTSMVVLRLLTGIGLGGTLPNAIALTAEYMPRTMRSTGVTLMFTGFSLGAAAGGFAAAGLIGRFGWPAVFVVGGAAPCVVAIFLLGLPESIRYLVLQGGRDSQIAQHLRRLAPRLRLAGDARFTATEPAEAGFPVARLFTNGRAAMTVLLWVIFFMSLLDLYFLNSWLPTVLHDSGLQLETAIRVTAMFQVGGAAGAFVLGRLLDRRKSFIALAIAYSGAAISVFFIGTAGSSPAVQILLVFAAGMCVIGGQTGTNALAAESYPTAIRATGVGWALGIGRIGSIAGPLLGAVLLSSQLEMKSVFQAAAAPPVIAVLAALLASRVSAQRP